MNGPYRLLAPVLLVAAVPGLARAEFLIGLTNQNALVTFDSATPGTVSSPIAVTGLVAGDTLVGIDNRPTTGLLYGLGATSAGAGRVYVINPLTGAVTSTVTLSTTLTGSFFGVDFNPVPDTAGLPSFRVVTNTDQNYRVNVDTGAVLTDGTLAYRNPADPLFGTNPLVGATAYTNNFVGATSTQQFDIDASFSVLSQQVPPNDGTLTTIGFLGPQAFLEASFDISGPTGIAYAVLNGLTLAQVNLGTGAATITGNIALTSGSIIGVAAPVGAPTAAIPAPGGLVLLGTGLATGLVGQTCRRIRRRG